VALLLSLLCLAVASHAFVAYFTCVVCSQTESTRELCVVCLAFATLDGHVETRFKLSWFDRSGQRIIQPTALSSSTLSTAMTSSVTSQTSAAESARTTRWSHWLNTVHDLRKRNNWTVACRFVAKSAPVSTRLLHTTSDFFWLTLTDPLLPELLLADQRKREREKKRDKARKFTNKTALVHSNFT